MPKDVTEEALEKMALNIICGAHEERFHSIINEAMWLKLRSGIEVPNYPQLRDMNRQFLALIEDPENWRDKDKPYLIDGKKAIIPELESIKLMANEYAAELNEALKVRVCVTGPFNLCLAAFGEKIYEDSLMRIASSLSEFIANSIIDTKQMKTKVVCIDEPSLGYVGQIEDELLIKAWSIATQPLHAKNVDVQVHLHSIAKINAAYETENISVVHAEDPNFINISPRELEKYDKFIRAGIARTNLSKIIADFSEEIRSRTLNKSEMESIIAKAESPRVIRDRLRAFWKRFGDRIKYVGPDCGLKFWPDQELAAKLLRNTALGIQEFRKSITKI